jgi:hypothetical protein
MHAPMHCGPKLVFTTVIYKCKFAYKMEPRIFFCYTGDEFLQQTVTNYSIKSNIFPLNLSSFGATTFPITTFSITTFRHNTKKTFSINNTQHNYIKC